MNKGIENAQKRRRIFRKCCRIFNITAVVLVLAFYLTMLIFGLSFKKTPPQNPEPTYPTEEMLALSAIEPDPETDYPAINDRLISSYPTVQMTRERQGDIYVGNPLYVYEFLPNGFFRLRYAYPLFFQEKIVAAVRMSSEGSFLPETLFHQYLQPLAGSSIAIVYDDDTCYAYDGTEFQVLYEFDPHHTEYRGNIEDTADLSAFTAELVLSEVAPVAVLEYEP